MLNKTAQPAGGDGKTRPKKTNDKTIPPKKTNDNKKLKK